jgi:hypothetical protein
MSRDFGDARRLDPAEFEGKFEKWIDYIILLPMLDRLFVIERAERGADI